MLIEFRVVGLKWKPKQKIIVTTVVEANKKEIGVISESCWLGDKATK